MDVPGIFNGYIAGADVMDYLVVKFKDSVKERRRSWSRGKK